ncbi:hypothetical protein [Scytonema millei]|nr:hypothetical protein [Scytonema millei]
MCNRHQLREYSSRLRRKIRARSQLYTVIREQGAGSREQRVGSRE